MDDFNEYKGTTAIACAMSEVLDNQFNTADTTNDIMIGIIHLIIKLKYRTISDGRTLVQF